MNIRESTLVLGLQLGNEGESKFIQTVFPDAHAYVRFNGSHLFPHVMPFRNGSITLYHLPTGIIRKDAKAIIGQGVLLNISQLREEIEMLNQHGLAVTPDRLAISMRCQIIMPWDIAHDFAEGKDDRKGIVHASISSIEGKAFTLEDMFTEEFESRFMQVGEEFNVIAKALGRKQIELKSAYRIWQDDGRFLFPFLTNTGLLLDKIVSKGYTAIYESNGGSMLDGMYCPYPNILPQYMKNPMIQNGITHIGVFSPYVTGVFEKPACLADPKSSDMIRKNGQPYGTKLDVTHIGWLDVPMLRFALTQGLDDLALMNLDHLTHVDEVQICDAYFDVYEDKEVPYLPGDKPFNTQITKRYTSFPTWKMSIKDIKAYEDLPRAARNIIAYIESVLDRKIKYISTGEDSVHMIIR